MNERKFLKGINNKNNRDGLFTYATVYNLLKDNKRLNPYKGRNIFEKLFNKNSKSAKQIIEDNFELILNKTHNQHLGTLLVLMLEEEETRNIALKKIDTIINKFKDTQNMDKEERSMLGFQQAEFLNILTINPEGAKITIEKFEEILESIPESKLFENTQILKSLTERTDIILNKFLEKNHKKLAQSLLENYKIDYMEKQQHLLDDYSNTISIIIKELLESENVTWIDIKRIGGGTFSDVYEIGNKVLKIGRVRETYNIPNHTRILQPLARTNLIDEKNNNKPFACIEVADKIDKITDYDIKEEKLYEVYRDLRDAGIIWTDVRYENVGILKQKNEPNLNGQKMDVAPNAVGFIDTPKGRELEAGEWVVLDTDWIYSETDKNIVWQEIGFARRFEERWLQERREKSRKEYEEQRKHEYKGEGYERE